MKDHINLGQFADLMTLAKPGTHLSDPALLPPGPDKDAQSLARQHRKEAAASLAEAIRLDMLKPFIITHQHQYGESAYIHWSASTPSSEEAERILESKYEPSLGESLFIESQVQVHELAGTHPDTTIRAPAGGGRWRMVVPVISTAHLPREHALDELRDEFSQLLEYTEGVMVCVGSDTPEVWERSPWFADVLRWFRANYGADQTWIRFDRDGDLIEALPVFDW